MKTFLSSNDQTLETASLDTLLDQAPIIEVEYDAICAAIITCSQPGSVVSLQALTQLKQDAILLNAALQRLYQHSDTYAVKLPPLQAQTNCLQSKATPTVARSSPSLLPDSTTIRTKTGFINPMRMLMHRLWRGLLNLKTFLASSATSSSEAAALHAGIQPVSPYLVPILGILSWIFLLPRLLVNLSLMIWHTIHPATPNNQGNMASWWKQLRFKLGFTDGHQYTILPAQPQQQVHTLSWWQRLQLEWRERRMELANDAIWVPGGLLIYFLLPVALIAGYLTVAMFAWDVVVATMRAVQELSRLSTLIKTHQDQALCVDEEKKAIHEAMVQRLETQFSYEKKRHALSIGNAFLACSLSFFALSCLLLPMVVPLIASCLIIPLAIAQFVLINWQYLPKIKPPSPNLALITTPSHTVVESMDELASLKGVASNNELIQPSSEPSPGYTSPHRHLPVSSPAPLRFFRTAPDEHSLNTPKFPSPDRSTNVSQTITNAAI